VPELPPDSSAEDAIAAALGGEHSPPPASTDWGGPVTADPGGDEASAPPPASPEPAPAAEPFVGANPEDELFPHKAHRPEGADLLVGGPIPGFGIPRHTEPDFETDEISIQARALPGRSAPGSKRRFSMVRRLGLGFWIPAIWVVVMILIAVLAPLLPISSPVLSTCTPNSGPAAGHLLGCDDVGRDVLARVIYGGQVSLVVGFASIGVALLVGGTLAVIAGYLRGIVDSVLGIITNVLLAYPYLVLGLAIVTFWGHSEFQVTIVIAIIAVAPLYRVVRANTIAFSERDYVLAAKALGSNRRRILWKQIVPDVVPTGITYALVGVALAVVGEGALSFLGQSVPPNTTPTWGNMIAEGSVLIPSIGSGTPVNIWIVLGPAIAMFLFILSINLIGDRLRTILDVREGAL
jgi:peptide/nickel transport system permease protein